MSRRIDVSILIPTWNRRDLLEASLQSAMAQDLENIEIIVYDNCSTDSTAEYLSTIHDPRVEVYRQQTNVGMCANVWSALTQAHGAYAVVLSDDDILAPNFITEGMKVLSKDKNPDTFFSATVNFIDSNSLPIKNDKYRHYVKVHPLGVKMDPSLFLRENQIFLCATIFPTSAIRGIGFIDNLFFDWTWWNALSLMGYKLYVSPMVLASYRQHEQSTSSHSTQIELARDTRNMYLFLSQKFNHVRELNKMLSNSESRLKYWESRRNPQKTLPFFQYSLSHLSSSTLRYMIMRAFSDSAVDDIRILVDRTYDKIR